MKKTGDSSPDTSAALPRRTFLAGAAAATGFTIVPRHVLGGQGQKAPSDKLNIAAVGIGGMGKNNVKRCETDNIVALCDVDFELCDPVFKKYPDAKRYKDFRVMLDQQKDIDAVIIATPDHSHAVIAMAAMAMGKHVYVQKPLTHSVHEARLLTETARKYKVASQMGNQGHSGRGHPAPVRMGVGRRDRQRPRGARLDQPARVAVGHRGGQAHGDARGSSRPRLGPVARARPRPPVSTRPITPRSGARGGISARARSATWAATSWTRCSGR